MKRNLTDFDSEKEYQAYLSGHFDGSTEAWDRGYNDGFKDGESAAHGEMLDEAVDAREASKHQLWLRFVLDGGESHMFWRHREDLERKGLVVE